MQYYPFDSRNSLYRDKLGALAEGETLRLKVLLHRDACVYSAFLCIRNDNEENFRELRLQGGEWLGDYRFYEGEITLTEGLYWYYFRYTSAHGDYFVSKSGASLGIVANEVNVWQQTVYSSDFNTPDWLDGGIIYQIFPDRFYNSGTKKQNIPQDRFICDDWYKIPEHRQSENPCRLCNDYYGGDLKGIEEKLDYIKDLGVNCIYLNPIFEAHSNHRYNTADYMKIDPSLGTQKDLESLVKAAKKKGIYIILDGVFSHTGDDSIYFNRKNRYNVNGAYNSPDSPYFSWFKFDQYPNKYSSWWGIETLPETNEDDLSFSNFITGENGVVRYWLKKGIKGWRLDVADELPDGILDKIRLAIKAEGEDNYLLGEVWEDASNKVSYGYRRRFVRGKQLDSVMNYPFANAIVDFVKNGNSERLINTVMEVLENYPMPAVKLLMNHIGTHDTARILTRLGTDRLDGADREAQAHIQLNEWEYAKGIRLLKLAAVLQYTLPGVPSLYYGDEAGIQGGSDPFCRATYPWGRENSDLVSFYKELGAVRRSSKAFASGEFIPVNSAGGSIAYIRKNGKNAVFVAVNSGECVCELSIPAEFNEYNNVLGKKPEKALLNLEPYEYSIIVK